MKLTERFLKAKHWQLFILTFGIPVIFQIFIIGKIITGLNGNTGDSSTDMFEYIKFFPLMMIIFIVTLFSWFWAIGIGLQPKVPENIKLKTGKFKVFFIVPLTYMILISIIIGIAISDLPLLLDEEDFPSDELMVWLGSLILLIHLFSMFCMFYLLYFVSKTIRTVELQREVTFSDFAGEFFMIWFYPVGIWVIQPKINRMAGF